MENAKKHREISKKSSSILQFISGFIISTIIVIFVLCLEIMWIEKYSDLSIMSYKEYSYKIYNYGLKDSSYDTIKIETPNNEDIDIVFNEGLKYVVHKDLLNMELEKYDIIKYKKGSFYFYDNENDIMCIKIIIDKNNSEDISCYKYKKEANLKAMAWKLPVYYVVVIFYYCWIVFIIKNGNNQNKKDNTEQQDKEPKNKDVKKTKKKNK